jgi:putative hydrolase of HD superfamily
METKNNHTTELLTTQTSPIIELFFEFAQLKNLYRQGWLKQDVSKLDCETVADHSFSVALLGYIIAQEHRPDLDSNKVMKLGLFHEIGEIHVGDITPHDNISSKEKSEKEIEAVKKVFSCMPNPQKYIDICLEYEEQTSPESIFVKQVDKLEMVMQANLYEKMGYSTLNEFYETCKQKINSPELKSIFDEIIKLRN